MIVAAVFADIEAQWSREAVDAKPEDAVAETSAARAPPPDETAMAEALQKGLRDAAATARAAEGAAALRDGERATSIQNNSATHGARLARFRIEENKMHERV